MNKNDNKAVNNSLKDYLITISGIILLSLTVIAFTGTTYLGSLLTYCLAFLFGAFYPFFLAFLLISSFAIIFHKKTASLKNKGNKLSYSGIFLIFFSALALGSSAIQPTDLSFADFNSFYTARMRGFASSIFSIDSFGNLGSLGGGYISLFFTVLLSSIWTTIGNYIFFIVLLLLGVFLLTYNPINRIVEDIQRRRREKVEYTSPYQKNRTKKENVTLNREVESEKTSDPELYMPINTTWSTPQSRQKTAFIKSNQDIFNVAPIAESNQFETVENTVKADETQSEKPVLEKTSETKESILKKPDESKKQKIDNDLFASVKPIAPVEKMQNETTKPTAIVETPQGEVENELTAKVQSEKPIEPIIKQKVEEEREVKTSIETASVIADDSEKGEFVFSPAIPKINPLETVAKNVQLKPKNEFTVNLQEKEPEEKIEEEKKEDSEEEIRDIEKRYFAQKQHQQIEAIKAKKMAQLEKKARLMRFVSDVPKFYNYNLPTDALLNEIDDSAKIMENSESAENKVKIINSVFNNYGVKAKAISYTIGASVTRFNIETEPGEKSDRITSVTEELQKALNGDKSVRVETVVEGRSTSGIEIGNLKPMAVSFKDVFQSIETNTTDNLLVPIGKDISGDIISFPLNKMPHLLIAGTTGSGKSVLVHSMIMTLIMRNYPSQLKLILIDPKQVEFVRYQECSHLFCPVISKPEAAVLALRKLCDEMDRRFAILSKYKMANLEGYNALRIGKEATMAELPYLVCIIDEFADLIMVGGKEVAMYVQRIGQKARAAGIHLIVATQRPSKDNVPMTIKANIPCRIGLSVSSQVDSRVILDEVGAETLLGKGDLLFKTQSKKSLIRAQSPFISDDEVERILNYVKERAGDPVYDKEFIELDEIENDDVDLDNIDPAKKLYENVKDFVMSTGITSKESIMRNFQVTSQKADTFLATMVSEGILSLGYQGSYILNEAIVPDKQ